MAWLRGWIEGNRHWSRKRLARELCQRWQWFDGLGRLKDFAARSFLLKLEARGVVKLPPLQLRLESAATDRAGSVSRRQGMDPSAVGEASARGVPTPVPAPLEPAFDLVIMMDGWLTRERGADWCAGTEKKDPKRKKYSHRLIF